MDNYRKVALQVKAVRFTREMAEGTEPLPDGIKMESRQLDVDETLISHKHLVGEKHIEVGEWLVVLPSNTSQVMSQDVFESVYRKIRASGSAEPVVLLYGQYSSQLVVNLKEIGIEPENETHRQELLAKCDEFVGWVLRGASVEASLGGMGR